MEQKIRARIIGTGSFAPPRRMTNAEFVNLVDTTDEWITSRTGIKERRIADENMATSDMAVEACKKALDMSGCSPDEIELLILGTVTPDHKLPATACVVQEKLGLKNAAAFDVVAACTGFITGLSISNSYIQTGLYKKILVVGCEKLSSITNFKDRNTCVLFGDGAGAAVISADETDNGIISTYIKSDGAYKELLWIKKGGAAFPTDFEVPSDGLDKILMNGADIFKIAVKKMADAAKQALEQANITSDDIAIVIPHQANIRIIEALAKRLKIDMSKVFLNIEKYGNTSAASIPIALDEANRNGLLKKGDYVLMVAFGGGLIWGSTLIKW